MTRVLMFGWEFPPYKSGGLGTACYGLAKGLAKYNVKITFVMPFAPEGAKARFVKLLGTSAIARNIKLKTINSPLTPYMTNESYDFTYTSTNAKGKKPKQVYGEDLFDEVKRYTSVAAHLAKTNAHDVIHAHDWMTYQAGIEARKASGKPLIVHLHATEFDRTGGHPDQRISHAEYLGLKAADRVITNSHFSKANIIKHYKIDPDKIDVVHWGIHDEKVHAQRERAEREKAVLFLGRVTIQKGPDYFIKAAKRVLEHEPDATFIMAGSGDMLPRCIKLAAELGIADRITFTGMLRGDDVHRAFQQARVFVMPSVAEPFGLVALESLKNGTPVIVSKQSGVHEVLNNALKVDFWDLDRLTEQIVSVLRHEPLQKELKINGSKEVEGFTLDGPARKTKAIYDDVIRAKL